MVAAPRRGEGPTVPRRGVPAATALPAFDAALLRRHDRPGPRYTSYPTAPQFSADFGATHLRAFAGQVRGAGRRLSLYVHVPFCLSPCFYCGCNRVITRDTAKVSVYAERLSREVALVSELFDPATEVIQLHIGGGTPNLLAGDLLARLVGDLRRAFALSDSSERDFSIELDPRSVPAGYPGTLASLGFNRASLGVQDFDDDVQRAVNRVQGVEETRRVIDACRAAGFRSINVDLIYGLPGQTPERFRRTLRTVLESQPDRLAVYAYAHLPQLFKAQRQIDAAALPGPDERLALLGLAIEELTGAGYHYIGMDHFARPHDDLVRAQSTGGLQRNFMGYTTHADTDLVGIGMSAISHVGESFSQNHRDLRTWSAAIDAGRLPTARGIGLSADDLMRAAVISELMCQGAIDVRGIERRYVVEFREYFADALAALREHERDGLVEIGCERISVRPRGRLLLRSLAMCFDSYLPRAAGATAPAEYSKAV